MRPYLIIFSLFYTLASCQVPPETWKENWLDHTQLLTRRYYDNDVAIYFDPDVDKSITWPNKYLHDVWVYTKNVYGQFGNDQHLYAIFHTGKYGGGHPATYFDEMKSFRNVIDCGKPDSNAWTAGTGNDLDLTTHEVAHIVEGASKGVHNSPAFPLWGDSKWAEIFLYDVYRGLGMMNEAARWFNMVANQHDDFPRPNTYWFRNWFLPIYDNHGEAQALNGFFELLAQHFPKDNRASQNRPQYTRNMNWGEFFHFWSGAAKTDLKNQATIAFGWNDQYEREFQQAKRDFPNIRY